MSAKCFHFEIIWIEIVYSWFFSFEVSHLRQSISRPRKEWIIKPNENIKDHQDIVNNKIRRLHPITRNNGSDPASSSISHPSGGADTNRYISNSLRQSLPSARSGDAEYSESTSQRSSAGYPVFFSIFASDCKSQCPMDSTRVPRELRVLLNMHNRVTVLCLFVVMASFVAIKWLVTPLPLRRHPPTVCSLTSILGYLLIYYMSIFIWRKFRSCVELKNPMALRYLIIWWLSVSPMLSLPKITWISFRIGSPSCYPRS